MIWCWLWSFLALFWLFSLKVAIICHDPNSVFIVNTIKFARVSMLKVVIKNRSLPHKWRPKMMFINQNLVAPNYRPWLGNSIRSSNWLPIEIKRGMSYYTPNAPNRFLHKNPFTHSIHIISHVHPMYIPFHLPSSKKKSRPCPDGPGCAGSGGNGGSSMRALRTIGAGDSGGSGGSGCSGGSGATDVWKFIGFGSLIVGCSESNVGWWMWWILQIQSEMPKKTKNHRQ